MLRIARYAKFQAPTRVIDVITSAASSSAAAPTELIITRPDDWHLHVRDGKGLEAVVPHTASLYGRAIIMPNLVPPVTSAERVSILVTDKYKALPIHCIV